MAPNSVSTPPTIQARYTMLLEPTARIISWGTRKMPLPMMVPTTMAVACQTPSTRGRSGAEDVVLRSNGEEIFIGGTASLAFLGSRAYTAWLGGDATVSAGWK